MNTIIYSHVLNNRAGYAVSILYRIKHDLWQHEILEAKIEFGKNCNGKFEKSRQTTERFSTNLGDVIINIDRKVNSERIEAFKRVVKEKKYVIEIIPVNNNPVYLECEEIKELFNSIDERKIYARYEQEHKKKKPADIKSSLDIEIPSETE